MKPPGESPKTFFFRIKGRQFASVTIGEVLRVMGGILSDLIGVVQYQIHAFSMLLIKVLISGLARRR
ncbi:MAG: hypothetical protein VR64_21955 [Desulfatitalea sp. BRH_c12]|nr:MAG: hypothetical protein VR64_21955 [Desulfatitalea sp. BRH_c12]